MITAGRILFIVWGDLFGKENLAKLDSYRYCGHSVLMGKVKNDWQNWDYVLKWFGTGGFL